MGPERIYVHEGKLNTVEESGKQWVTVLCSADLLLDTRNMAAIGTEVTTIPIGIKLEGPKN